ncbi:MAG: 1,4-dihydroxy-2-naphthoate polyprenyltransferase [Deltaproteobacteria bacterium]|nr:MAG: 1,4-dihydroxy-2-naphthoate polyprenyltransferase [Deltaproteobacteria bacterium]
MRLPRPGSLGAWILAIRPRTLPAAIAPVVVGSAVAHALGVFSAGPALAAALGAVLIQIGTNFANDVFDFEKGADTEARVGPPRAVASGLLTPAAMKRGAAVAFGLAGACGIYLTAVAGWPVVAIGVASVLAGLAYTGGPFPLGYHGLGDLFVLIFFGFVAVGGTVYVQAGEVPAWAWPAALGVGSVAAALIVVNNLRDRETDAAAGKRTLAVRLGRRGSLLEYGGLLLVAAAVGVYYLVVGRASVYFGVALLPYVLFAVAAVRGLSCADTPVEYGRCLGATARLLVLYAAGLGIVIASR